MDDLKKELEEITALKDAVSAQLAELQKDFDSLKLEKESLQADYEKEVEQKDIYKKELDDTKKLNFSLARKTKSEDDIYKLMNDIF